MNQLLAVAKKELRASFLSPVALLFLMNRYLIEYHVTRLKY